MHSSKGRPSQARLDLQNHLLLLKALLNQARKVLRLELPTMACPYQNLAQMGSMSTVLMP